MSEDMLDMREERSIENMVESAAVLIDMQASRRSAREGFEEEARSCTVNLFKRHHQHTSVA